MLPEGRYKVAAALSICMSVHPFVRHTFSPKRISKSIEGNLMKLDTLIKGQEQNARNITLSPVFTELLPS